MTASKGKLTEDELCVLECVARGLPNKLISKELLWGEETIKDRIKSIKKKLGVTFQTRVTLVNTAYAMGLVKCPCKYHDC